MTSRPDREIERSFDVWCNEIWHDTTNVIVVENCPITDLSRYEKLIRVIRKRFGEYGTILDFAIPVSGEGSDRKTLGYALIEYGNAEEAARAIREADGKKLDGAHTFAVSCFEDLRRMRTSSEQQ